MPRDVFHVAPDGRTVMQGYVSFLDYDDESQVPGEELIIHLTEEQVRELEEAFDDALERMAKVEKS